MAFRPFLLAAALMPVSLVACGGDDGGGNVTPEGTHYHYVANQVFVPTSNTQARDYGLDLNADGTADNQLGMVLSTLAGMGFDIQATIEFHKSHGKAATLTATYPPGRFGALDIDARQVRSFKEKPKGDGAMINGGFFVLSPRVLDYLSSDADIWEQQPLRGLAADGELMAYEHQGFWQPMDTLRDKHLLEELWASGKAPWKKWA